MKRMFVLLFSVVLSLCVFSFSFADTCDFSNSTVEELLQLQEQIQEELFEKGQFVEIGSGEFVVGKDIAPGSYEITFFEKSYNMCFVDLIVYNTPESRMKYESAKRDSQLRWAAIEEIINNDSAVQISEPEMLDDSLYIATNLSEYRYVGDVIRVTLSEGQLLYLKYDGNKVSAVIKKAQGLFME